MSPKYATSEFAAICRGSGIKYFLTTTANAPKLLEMMGEGAVIEFTHDCMSLISLGTHAAVTESNSLMDGAALLKFTSGSTGEPKGIVLGPSQVYAEARNVVETLGLTTADRIQSGAPIFHSYGFDLGVLASLFSGAKLVLQDFFVPRRIAADLDDQGITVFLGVPNLYRAWIDGAPPGRRPLSCMRYLLSCTAPLNPATILAFHERFHMPICQHYGSSETGAVTNHVPAEVLNRPESIGLPMKHVSIRICDSHGNEVPLGEEGEVVVESDATARGYLMGAPESSPFRPDGFRTGDLAVRDTEGYLTLRGRLNRIINVGGFKVSPEEVRQVLENHPSVREAAVFGVRNASGDETVVALVAIKDRATEKDLIAFCYGKLADYKVPRWIELCDELPRGASGKVRLVTAKMNV